MRHSSASSDGEHRVENIPVSIVTPTYGPNLSTEGTLVAVDQRLPYPYAVCVMVEGVGLRVQPFTSEEIQRVEGEVPPFPSQDSLGVIPTGEGTDVASV